MFHVIITFLLCCTTSQIRPMETEEPNDNQKCLAVERLACAGAHILTSETAHSECSEVKCNEKRLEITLFDSLRMLAGDEIEKKRATILELNYEYFKDKQRLDDLVKKITNNACTHITGNLGKTTWCTDNLHPEYQIGEEKSYEQKWNNLQNHLEKLVAPFIIQNYKNNDDYIQTISGPLTNLCIALDKLIPGANNPNLVYFDVTPTETKDAILLRDFLKISPNLWYFLWSKQSELKQNRENYYTELGNKEKISEHLPGLFCFGSLGLLCLARLGSLAPRLFKFDTSVLFLAAAVGMGCYISKILTTYSNKQLLNKKKEASVAALERILVPQPC